MGESTTDPVLAVLVFVGVPLASEEGVLGADDLAIKERRQSGVFLRQPFDLQVATQVGILHINMLHSKHRQHDGQATVVTLTQTHSGCMTGVEQYSKLLTHRDSRYCDSTILNIDSMIHYE